LFALALPTACITKLDRFGILFESPSLAWAGIKIMELSALRTELKHWHNFSPQALGRRLQNHQPIPVFASSSMGHIYSVLFEQHE
jgi:acid phosphatase family membrane protein YuiD